MLNRIVLVARFSCESYYVPPHEGMCIRYRLCLSLCLCVWCLPITQERNVAVQIDSRVPEENVVGFAFLRSSCQRSRSRLPDTTKFWFEMGYNA